MPRPSDRELHRRLYRLATSGEPVDEGDLTDLIEWHNQAAAQRCRDCPRMGEELDNGTETVLGE